MGAVVEIKIDKVSLQDLEAMASRLEKETPELVKALAREAAEAARGRAPVSTGKVRRSIKSEVHNLSAEGPEAAVVSDWFVTRLQNYGYAPHRAWVRSVRRWADIPGKAYNPEGYFIEPAVEEALDRFLDIEADKVVDKL